MQRQKRSPPHTKPCTAGITLIPLHRCRILHSIFSVPKESKEATYRCDSAQDYSIPDYHAHLGFHIPISKKISQIGNKLSQNRQYMQGCEAQLFSCSYGMPFFFRWADRLKSTAAHGCLRIRRQIADKISEYSIKHSPVPSLLPQP